MVLHRDQDYLISSSIAKKERSSTPSAILQMTPSWVVQLTHQKDGMPSRGTLTSLRSGLIWNSWGSTRPSARSRTWVRATSGINTVWGMKRLRAALPRRTWVYRWMKSWTQAGSVCSQPRRPTVSWAASKEARPAGWGRGLCASTPLRWDPPGSPAYSSGAFSTGKTWSCWSGCRGGPQKLSGAGARLLWGQAERVGVVEPGEEQAAGRHFCDLPVLKGGL